MKVRAILRFKNEAFIQAREKAGFATQMEMARITGVHQQTINSYENFRAYPRTEQARQRIQEATGALCEDMFPQLYRDAVDQGLGRPIQRIFTMAELPAWTRPEMIEQNPESIYDLKQLKEITGEALKSLTEREAKILKMRFGLGDGNEYNLTEAAQTFKVSKERIRQIEATALRKLKHSSRNRAIRSFVGKE